MRKVVVVLGASKGIGSELVSLFAMKKDMDVVALARTIENTSLWLNHSNVYAYNFDLIDYQ